MLIVVVVQDEFSFQVLVVLNVEDVIDVDIPNIPIYKKNIEFFYLLIKKTESNLFFLSHKIKFLC